ncbi:helix-turn-helix domain-containing protein, partial [Eisenbergiella massiliensis]|uniref:helix-turn-helix domain-containing protein n=2 Tax=Eisenbergiella TaxID=1432051 RepID=UPI002F3F0CFD
MKKNEAYQTLFTEYPDIVTVSQMGEMLGISTKSAYRLLKENKIEHFRIGRIYKIPKLHIFSIPVLYTEATISGTKDKILFCDFLLYWLHLIRNSIAESTYSGYQNVIERHIIPYFQPKNYTLADIEKNPIYIQEYYTYELKERKVSTNTVIHRHANIRSALEYAFQV